MRFLGRRHAAAIGGRGTEIALLLVLVLRAGRNLLADVESVPARWIVAGGAGAE
jgi:hypothetical protein